MLRRRVLSLLSVAAITQIAHAKEPEIFTGLVPGVAVGGYDPVSYFRKGGPQMGSEKFAAEWKGAEWRFTSEENLAAFKASPETYAPQYGGYCAYAVSKGATAKGDPEAWTVAGGKLYLNFSPSVRSIWRKDIPGNIAKADTNWPGVLH
jgi:YHS domain-containing protein